MASCAARVSRRSAVRRNRCSACRVAAVRAGRSVATKAAMVAAILARRKRHRLDCLVCSSLRSNPATVWYRWTSMRQLATILVSARELFVDVRIVHNYFSHNSSTHESSRSTITCISNWVNNKQNFVCLFDFVSLDFRLAAKRRATLHGTLTRSASSFRRQTTHESTTARRDLSRCGRSILRPATHNRL
jgi:hypothetical protein